MKNTTALPFSLSLFTALITITCFSIPFFSHAHTCLAKRGTVKKKWKKNETTENTGIINKREIRNPKHEDRNNGQNTNAPMIKTT